MKNKFFTVFISAFALMVMLTGFSYAAQPDGAMNSEELKQFLTTPIDQSSIILLAAKEQDSGLSQGAQPIGAKARCDAGSEIMCGRGCCDKTTERCGNGKCHPRTGSSIDAGATGSETISQ